MEGELLYLWIWRNHSARSAQIVFAKCLGIYQSTREKLRKVTHTERNCLAGLATAFQISTNFKGPFGPVVLTLQGLLMPGGGYSVERWVWGCAAQIGCFFGLSGLPMAPFLFEN